MRRALITAVLIAGLAGAPVVLPAAPAGADLKLTWERSWPGFNYRSSPTIADIDGDGVNDVVVGDRNGWVRAFRADGSDVPGWPQRVSIGGTHPGIEGAPTVADLDRDGTNEVLVGAGLLSDNNQHGGVVVFRRDGSVRWTYQTADRREGPDGFSDAVFGPPSVADVTGDGFPNVVFGAFDQFIHVLDRHGGTLGRFDNQDTVFSSPALLDVDGDRRAEIFIGGDSSCSPSGDCGHAPPGGLLRLLEMSGTSLVERWRHHVGEIIQSSPALGDIDGDGQVEVVFGTGEFYRTADSNRVFALNVENGSGVPGWPVTTDGRTWSSPALGDLNGDGRLDVVIGSLGRGTSSKLWAFSGTGAMLWNVDPAHGTRFPSGDITGSPVIADVNGDGKLEVLLSGGSAGYIRAGANGALVDLYDTDEGYGRQHLNSPAVGKFGSRWRVVSASFREVDRQGNPTSVSYVSAYDIPAPGKGSPWPMFQRNAAHTGGPEVKTCERTDGYWVLDLDGEVYPFCARFYGSIPSVRAGGAPVGPVQARGIVRTPTGKGYWILDQVGGMFAFGDAGFFGSLPGRRQENPNIGPADVIDLSPTGSGGGYWLLDSQGGIHSFGDAGFFGSIPGLRESGVPIGQVGVVGIASAPKGRGYWMVDEIGGLFAFGDAGFFGSIPALRNEGVAIGPARIVAMVPTASGKGYWMADDQGGLFAFGDAGFFGSIPALRNAGVAIGQATIVDMVPTPDGKGYWMIDDKGGVFAFGNAPYFGSLPQAGVSATAVGLAPAG